MRAGLLSAQPAATWTGNRWINDDAYISLWGPGCRFTRSHLNDYRYMLERATHELCTFLRIDNRPRRTLIHSLRIQRLAAIGTEEAPTSITVLQQEYRRLTKRLSNSANKERRRQRDSAQTNGEYGLPLNEQGTCFKSASTVDGLIGSSSSTIESNRHFPSRATRVPGVDTPTNQMSQTPGLGSGGGVRLDGRTHSRSLTTAASLSSGRNRKDTPTEAKTDQTPGPGPGGGYANLVRTRVLVLAGAASDGRAARSAHHLDHVGNGGVAHGREHGCDELGRDKCPRDDLHVNQARQQVWVEEV
jgi:hypothetical protein